MGQDVPDVPAHDDVLRFLPELREYARTACSRQNSGAQPDDVVQEALLRAWTAGVGSRGHAHSGASWLCGIAHNVVRENKRRSRGGAALFADLSREQAEVMQAKSFEGPLPAERLDKDEADRALAVAWGNPPPPRREILRMHFLDGRSVPEIAVALKRSTEATKSQLRRALSALRLLILATAGRRGEDTRFTDPSDLRWTWNRSGQD